MKRLWRIACIILLLVVVGELVRNALFPREPVYQGITASVYLDSYALYIDPKGGSFGLLTAAQSQAIDREGKLAETALRQMGIDLIPVLLQKAAAKDSKLKSKLNDWGQRYLLVQNTLRAFGSWPMRYAFTSHSMAKDGFELLGPSAVRAVPQLMELLRDPDEDVVANVAMSLSAIGPDARQALPVLMDVAKNRSGRARANAIFALGSLGPAAALSADVLIEGTKAADPGVTFYALQSLGRIHAKPEIVVPILQAVLDTPQTDNTRYDVAIAGLGRFGASSESAVPSIIQHLHNKVDYVRRDATNALEQIEKDVAAKKKPKSSL
ncbi:MAG: lyase domain protein repeat-containing protein [Verrucomicrobiales bacterium]|nr:lyase domain protein repeat-containing protein [Verrucomicrobiales bacterium]